jgi:LmbE family N-acetylglucosaminyl deacetylase
LIRETGKMTENEIRRVMTIMAHPDDPEFSAGGTIARWAREGKEIIYLILTSGDKGSSDPEMTAERLAQLRQQEQRAAAEKLGVQEVVFLGYPDAELTPSLELRRDIVRQIRRYKPDAVITLDPTTRFHGNTYINHPDHRAAGDAALDAVFPTARDRLNFPEQAAEGLEPHKVLEVYLAGTSAPDFWVDTSDTIDLKIEALLEHRTQIKAPHKLGDRIRERDRATADGQEMEYAEQFKRMILG